MASVKSGNSWETFGRWKIFLAQEIASHWLISFTEQTELSIVQTGPNTLRCNTFPWQIREITLCVQVRRKITETSCTTCYSDKSLRVFWRILVGIFVLATEFCSCNKLHKLSLIWFCVTCCDIRGWQQNSVADTKLLTKILQYIQIDLQCVAATCCQVCSWAVLKIILCTIHNHNSYCWFAADYKATMLDDKDKNDLLQGT